MPIDYIFEAVLVVATVVSMCIAYALFRLSRLAIDEDKRSKNPDLMFGAAWLEEIHNTSAKRSYWSSEIEDWDLGYRFVFVVVNPGLVPIVLDSVEVRVGGRRSEFELSGSARINVGSPESVVAANSVKQLFLVVDAPEQLDPRSTYYPNLELTYYSGGKKAGKVMACAVQPSDSSGSQAEMFWSMAYETPLASLEDGSLE